MLAEHVCTLYGHPDLIKLQDEVRDDFGWDINEDWNVLNWLIEEVERRHLSWSKESRKRVMRDLKSDILDAGDRGIAVIGAAAQICDVEDVLDKGFSLIFADGAFGLLQTLDEKRGVEGIEKTLCIVSDGDGVPHIYDSTIARHVIMLHAHGNARRQLNDALATWCAFDEPPRLVLSHQTPADISGAHNPGGFTDGDRALCLLNLLGIPPEDTKLVGFDHHNIGKWSGNYDSSLKRRKLRWMRRIVEVLGHGG